MQIQLTRRTALKTVAAAGAAILVQPIGGSLVRAASKLEWRYFQANEAGFDRTPVLLTGESEAILIDGGFTLSDGRAVAEAIRATGKRLTTIYVSCNDPDFYFSLKPVVEAFPDAKVIAASATVEAIKANVEGKLETWGPQLKDNGPQTLADVVMPQPDDRTSLTLEGNTIEIVTIEGMKDRRYLFVPELKAIFGGVLVYSGSHVWVADEATTEGRQKWIEALDAMATRKPEIVVPAHKSKGGPEGVEAIGFTRDYLVAFNEAAAAAKDSGELIAAMTKRYPDLPGVSTLELGAKVAKGEMKWG
ncbi:MULTISPECIES: MBL fold metallo-hydrolase [unclassified Ensifer]|uniref:MBL fold metallo-hydrolase n=1 Tax=unclassified Ensifer TaxID=2633371 RepID=UPI000812EBAB|nr:MULTISPECIES: MBL fold metallo-hydrolase [unclassified Ensifer]OCP01709.1 MBL fold metallo-hydrolase [Ensifer sp. LC14]OCP09497.1 MBL fold metallo-hydrolase [Ensifer sp. LC13]OCP10670.1 MBL fold metallo-hydrolase [Ensifer sp. LC11]OCP32746.1 MBL fold metallo-hydrolase [Ensifer sp. LC499]